MHSSLLNDQNQTIITRVKQQVVKKNINLGVVVKEWSTLPWNLQHSTVTIPK